MIISMKRARFPRSSWSQFVFPSQQKSFGCVTMPSQASAFAQDTSCARRTLVPRFNANDSLLLYEVKRSNCRVNLRILKCILVTFSSALWQTLAWCPSHSCTLWSFPRDWKEPCLSRWCCSWASALLQCHPFALHPLACCRPCAPQNVLDTLCVILSHLGKSWNGWFWKFQHIRKLSPAISQKCNVLKVTYVRVVTTNESPYRHP